MVKNVERTDFGQKLKAAREAAELTQEELARRSGIYVYGIAKFERGVREPTWPTVLKLAKALGVSVAAFEGALTGERPKPVPRGRPRKVGSPKRSRRRPR
jgi:transcriptional regulator with XRE-family HTH domain